MPHVVSLAVSPVRSLALAERDELELTADGVADNRRFFLVDETGRRFTQSQEGRLALVAADYDARAGRLAFRFPDGTRVEGDVELADPVETEFIGGRIVRGRFVRGPWADAISGFIGRPLRLVRSDECHTPTTYATLLSRASLDELARRAGVDGIDRRRFRMLIGVDGCDPHAEDAWRDVRVGEALLRVHGPVGRCVITKRNPETGEIDLDTLGALASYREQARAGIPFGVYASVEQPGRVRVGDPVEPL